MINILKDYIEKRINLVKMEAVEKVASISGLVYFLVLALVFAMFFLIFLILGIGLWIGYLLGNYAYGLLIMSGICLLFLIITFLLKKYIKNFASNTLIKLLNP